MAQTKGSQETGPFLEPESQPPGERRRWGGITHGTRGQTSAPVCRGPRQQREGRREILVPKCCEASKRKNSHTEDSRGN